MSLLQQVNQDFEKCLTQTGPIPQMESLAAQMADKNMFMEGKLFPTFLKPYPWRFLHAG